MLRSMKRVKRGTNTEEGGGNEEKDRKRKWKNERERKGGKIERKT
jgi:hypothetical protein